jgi:CBS-domain-containing membrane protein
MKLWRVDDVMTGDVVSVRADTPYRDVVDLLISSRVSAVPVLDRSGQVIGVVSEADLMHKVEAAGEKPRVFPSVRGRARRAKAAGRTAGDVMTTPAVTVARSVSLAGAARQMRDGHVKRLPVVDDANHLVGIVTRGDLLKVHLRSDAQLRRDVVDRVVDLVLGADGSTVQVTVADGVVILRGRLRLRSTAETLLRLSRHVPGVVAVTDNLRYEFDDSMATGSTIGAPFGVA